MEKVVTRTAEIWKDKDDIFWVKLIPGMEIDMEDITDNLLVTRNITGGKPHLRVLDSRGSWKMTADAQKYFKQEDTPEKTIARAVLTTSLIDKIFKRFLLTLFKLEVPLKFFTSEEDAVKWLLNFKRNP